jgi:hypothetical protein
MSGELVSLAMFSAAAIAFATAAAFIASWLRRHESAERWRPSADEAHRQARRLDSLVANQPAGSPGMHRRIAAVRTTFYALASTGPDLRSRQAAYAACRAMDDLDIALSANDASSLGQARGRLDHALAPLGTTAQPNSGTRTRPTGPSCAARPTRAIAERERRDSNPRPPA